MDLGEDAGVVGEMCALAVHQFKRLVKDNVGLRMNAGHGSAQKNVVERQLIARRENLERPVGRAGILAQEVVEPRGLQKLEIDRGLRRYIEIARDENEVIRLDSFDELEELVQFRPLMAHIPVLP